MDAGIELQKYGVGSGNVRKFVGPVTPELLDYLDLVNPSDQQSLLPDGVAENQGRALLFFVDESHLAQPISEQELRLKTLRRSLACRGERTYLARISPGELKVVPVSLQDQMPEWKIYRPGTGEAVTFFSRLMIGEYDGAGQPTAADEVFKEMFELLEQGADELARRIGRTDVLSLIGRALFFRFLRDRRVIEESYTKTIAPKASTLKDCFDTTENASATCNWLDSTFNGDFLHLSGGGQPAFFETIARKSEGAIFAVLSSIVRCDKPVGGDGYQGTFDWGDFDFAHIPIGLLSQVYEKFVWKWDHQEARDTSVHYTPRNIATMLVDEAFDELPNSHKARILDPACGAGVFLVLAFRRLYRQRWKATGRRPDTKAIRLILENQLTGFDISDSALRLSALSLYLTAIELDPEPIPPEKLKFKNLRDEVLFNLRDKMASGDSATLGSLNSTLNNGFRSKFDLVLSNPPWTSLPKKEAERAAELTRISRDVIRRRGNEALADNYLNPDSAPDLPFLWKSSEWCKPNGRIAMALPARILLKQEEIPRRARETLLQLIEVTGIVNGSNLSDTNVWPEMQQPFMLLFARNKSPKPAHQIRFITPLYDKLLNERGELRIDSKSAQPIEVSATVEAPWLWKALAVGTSLDADVVHKLQAPSMRNLKEYWESDLDLSSGRGYSVEPQQDQHDASFLRGLPDLSETDRFQFTVEPALLERFPHERAARPRSRDLYRKPLVLVKESPGTEREEGWALLSFSDVAFSRSFYGYSAANHPEGKILVRYVHLLVHSVLWMYYALLTSPKLGAERRSIYKSVLDDLPISPLSKLSNKQKTEILLLSARLERSDRMVFREIDLFFAALYGLDELDLEVINDTLCVCLPYQKSRERACQRPSESDCEIFRKRLESLLSPFLKTVGKQAQVRLLAANGGTARSGAPFGVLVIGPRGKPLALSNDPLHAKILSLANETGATRIIQEVVGGLAVGISNQYRYWTPSRARLLAAEILREHTAPFEVN